MRIRSSRGGEAPEAAPIVFVEKVGGALKLAAVDPEAARAGLSSGMTLADAQARLPQLESVVHQPDHDQALLEQVLHDFGRFTPMIALDAPHGLSLDITGCDHLFGGEDGLMQATAQRAARMGLQLRQAVASTPHAARALCRFGRQGRYEFGQDRAAVRQLPVGALEISARDEQALRRAGLKRIGDLDDRARGPLAARFGTDFPARLARILGDEDVRITPYRPPAPLVSDRIFFEPIAAPEDIERVLSDLMEETAVRLALTGQGGRGFEAGFFRVDGVVRHVEVLTGHPTRDVKSVLRLFRERMAAMAHPIEAGFGFDQIRLSVTAADTLSDRQQGLDGDDELTDEAFGELIDRLTARLGADAVLRFVSHASYIPERAQRLHPAFKAQARTSDWPAPHAEEPPLRPLQIFSPPQPVETLAEVPDGSPLRFRWRRVLHHVARSEGPERIAGEWWRAPDQRTRDYYRVEDTDGRRFWLFRQGLYGQTPEPRWYIHGLFP